MEGLVREKMTEHLSSNKLISESHHGFISSRSCSTNLLAVLSAWIEVHEEGKSIGTIYLDFAFDTVLHKHLSHKLDGLGVQGKILGSICSFLSDSTHKVIMDGEES